MKAFMLAGVSSGIGKTTISMALMSAFNNVSPFKVGPDYIDTGNIVGHITYVIYIEYVFKC